MERLPPIKSFGIGAVINIVGLPFAPTYFAAICQVLKADLAAADAALLIIGYNIVYALPFLMPVILARVGIALVADAILYITSGEGLF